MNPTAPAPSPLVRPGDITAYGRLPAPGEHTGAELAALIGLLTAHRPGIGTVTVGHSRDSASRTAARAFAEAWRAVSGRSVLAVADWPEQAASWLRPAQRFTAQAPDAWVVAAAPLGWAQMARRLRLSTAWVPERTFGFASLAEPRAVALAGPDTLDGMRGATADGGTWEIRHGWLTTDLSERPDRPVNATPPLFPERPAARTELAPGAVHVPGWLTVDQQRDLVAACRGWATGPVPIRHTRLPRGGVMSVQTVCIGWHWQPYRYTRTAGDVNGERVAEFPDWMVGLGRRALADAYQDPAAAAGYHPDTALINFYDGEARLGMHQDKDEKSDAPVVSLSIGDSCLFRLGNTATRNRPWTDIELASGDLLVFGGPSRLAYHGVPEVHPGTGDPAVGLTSGRLNITMRVTGLPG